MWYSGNLKNGCAEMFLMSNTMRVVSVFNGNNSNFNWKKLNLPENMGRPKV